MLKKAQLQSLPKDELADLEWAQKKLNRVIEEAAVRDLHFAVMRSSIFNEPCRKVLKQRLNAEGYQFCTGFAELSANEQQVLISEGEWVGPSNTYFIVKLKPVTTRVVDVAEPSGETINAKLMKELTGGETVYTREDAKDTDESEESPQTTDEKKTMTEDNLCDVVEECETMFLDFITDLYNVSVDEDTMVVKMTDGNSVKLSVTFDKV